MAGDAITVTGNRVEHNVAQAYGAPTTWSYGGGIYCFLSSDVLIGNNTLRFNTSSADYQGSGSGIALEGGCDRATVVGNRIEGNRQAAGRGGGVYIYASHDVRIEANRILDNDAGVGVYLRTSPVTLILTNNLIHSHTYGVYAVSGTTATLYNTLFHRNSDSDIGGSGIITHTDPVTGQDPLLDGDYHLRPGSPAIDAGASLPWLTTDIDSDPRPIGARYDIGADEAYPHVYLPLVMRDFP